MRPSALELVEDYVVRQQDTHVDGYVSRTQSLLRIRHQSYSRQLGKSSCTLEVGTQKHPEGVRYQRPANRALDLARDP